MEAHIMKPILLAGVALAILVSTPAGARVHHRASPGPYWSSYGSTAPLYRGYRGRFSTDPDPFIRGQIRRDIPESDRGE
jgi:hypothetical protein